MIVKLSGHSIKTSGNHKVTVDELGTSKDPNPSIESTDGFNLTEISNPPNPTGFLRSIFNAPRL